MASSRTPSSSSSQANVVHKLADLFRTNGHRLRVHGDSKVCFTSESLTLLNSYFHSANLDITLPIMNGHLRTNSMPISPPVPPIRNLPISTKLRDDLKFLHDFLQQIQVVKLIQTSPTLQGNVFLYLFKNVTCLELKKIQPHFVRGLSILRDQLETLICSQSVEKIENLIGGCGGDNSQPAEWPRLKQLLLDHNSIARIDQSLKYLTALEVLDLSHNRLQDCSKILDIIPRVKHLNLSSNQLRVVPAWSEDKGRCHLLTLKIRQNSLEELTGIEMLVSIEELDLSDNFMTHIPEQIRHLSNLKRIYFARNPFTYDTNYRQKLITNLSYVFSQETRELMIDNLPLTLKEKQKIPSRRKPSNSNQGLTYYSPSTSSHNTANESATEPESLTTASSVLTVVSRRSRTRRKVRDARLRSLDADETPTEHASSGSDHEEVPRRARLGKVVESRHEADNNYLTTQITTIPGSVQQVEPDDYPPKPLTSPPIASSIPKKFNNDRSQSPKQRKGPRPRKSDQPTKIILEVVDVSNTFSDDTAVPDSPISEKNLSFSANHQTPIPVLEPKLTVHEENLTGDSIRTIFFVTDQTSNDENTRSLTIELDPMYLLEKDNNNEEYLEKIRYSTMKLLNNNESDQKLVEFTYEKRRNEIERRVYSFDTIQDKQAFVEEVERYLETSTSVELKPDSNQFLECTKCGKTFPPLATMNNIANGLSPICLSCQNATLNSTNELISGLQLNTTVDISSDEIDLDHRLHFQVATEYFTHNDEQIKLHFKCFVVRSTTTKYFIAQTILTNYGIYIFQYEPSNKDKESEYILVGKDLLTNVLMLDIGYRLQTFTIELQSAAFAFLLADQQKTQKIVNHILEVLSPIVQSGEGALQKISRISSDEYRQRLFEIIKIECNIDEPNDDMIDFYSIIIRMDQNGNSQMIALLLLRNWILMIEDAYATIDSRHVRLPALPTGDSSQQLKCDLMHLVNVTNYINNPKLFVFDFVDESETKEIRWKLEGLSNESKDEFLTKVRNSYKTFMDIPMPEKSELV